MILYCIVCYPLQIETLYMLQLLIHIIYYILLLGIHFSKSHFSSDCFCNATKYDEHFNGLTFSEQHILAIQKVQYWAVIIEPRSQNRYYHQLIQ